jgi:hypothetical protein
LKVAQVDKLRVLLVTFCAGGGAADFVGQADRLAVLAQRLRSNAVQWMHEHHENAKFMCTPLFLFRLKSALKPLPIRCATA